MHESRGNDELARLVMLLRRAARQRQHRGDQRDAGTIMNEIAAEIGVPSLAEPIDRLGLIIAARPLRTGAR